MNVINFSVKYTFKAFISRVTQGGRKDVATSGKIFWEEIAEGTKVKIYPPRFFTILEILNLKFFFLWSPFDILPKFELKNFEIVISIVPEFYTVVCAGIYAKICAGMCACLCAGLLTTHFSHFVIILNLTLN